MTRIVMKSKVGRDGVLQLTVPLGLAEADHEVLVTVESVPPAVSAEDWRPQVLATAGRWQGEFEQPTPGVLEEREPLS